MIKYPKCFTFWNRSKLGEIYDVGIFIEDWKWWIKIIKNKIWKKRMEISMEANNFDWLIVKIDLWCRRYKNDEEKKKKKE